MEWLERVPAERHLAWAAAALAGLLVVFAIIVAREGGWVGPIEGLLAVIALGVIFLSRVRVGAPLAIATAGVFVGLEALSGRLDDGVQADTAAATFVLLASLLASSYLRLGIRRRDAELAIAAQTIAELTMRDRVTELLSGGRQPTWIESELERARRHHHQLALVLVRPDRWDEFEELGEDVALRVLEAVAEVIGSELRAIDIALRRDPWTFSLILPETSADGARVAAERIRLNLHVRVGDVVNAMVGVSAGVATFPRDASTNEELVRVAGRALDRATTLGGNRTVCASLESPSPSRWTLAAAADAP
jgi:diguanylate cyclase (GGDEF)-like protein